MSDITLINDSEQSQLVTNGLAKNGELYLKKEGSTNAGAIVVYDSGSWRTFSNEVSAGSWNGNTYSVEFDGTNDYCLFTETVLSSGGLTFSAWVNLSNLSGGQEPIIGDDGNLSYWFFNAGNKYFYVRDASGSQSYGGPWSGTPVIDTWYHMMLIDDGNGVNNSSVKVYIDGSFAANLRTTGLSGFRFDTLGRSGGRYFSGKMDEVAIWESDQTSNIAAIYNSGTPGDLSSYNPLHWYRMGDNDGGTGTTITDQGSGGNNGTLTNGPTFSTSVPS